MKSIFTFFVSLEFQRGGRRADSGGIDGVDLDLICGERLEMRQSDDAPSSFDCVVKSPASARSSQLDAIFQQRVDFLVHPLKLGRSALNRSQLELARSSRQF